MSDSGDIVRAAAEKLLDASMGMAFPTRTHSDRDGYMLGWGIDGLSAMARLQALKSAIVDMEHALRADEMVRCDRSGDFDGSWDLE
jgi:hypothetical protein